MRTSRVMPDCIGGIGEVPRIERISDNCNSLFCGIILFYWISSSIFLSVYIHIVKDRDNKTYIPVHIYIIFLFVLTLMRSRDQ